MKYPDKSVNGCKCPCHAEIAEDGAGWPCGYDECAPCHVEPGSVWVTGSDGDKTMCVYCMTADEFFKNPEPPVWPLPAVAPYVPQPAAPPAPGYVGWDLERLKTLLDVLERIKALEDTLKCPCVPAKADYIKILKDRIQALEDGLEICPDCKRWWVKPMMTSHSRVVCLGLQLDDAKEEEALVKKSGLL